MEDEIKNENSKLRSSYWNYFDRRKIDGEIFGFCKVGNCKSKIGCPTGATTGLFTHLSTYHPKEAKVCEEKRTNQKKQKREEKEKEEKSQPTVDGLFMKQALWPSNSQKSIDITKAIGRMLALDLLSYDFVEGQGFKELMKLVVPQYRIPCRTTFSRNILPTMYKDVKCQTINQITIDFVDLPSFSFTTDIWSSRSMESYISFCLIYLTADFELRSVALENKPFQSLSHTGEAILESLEKSLDDWSLPRNIPIYVLRDNGANMKSAMNLSQSFTDLCCFAHTLQLAIHDAISEIEGMQTMLGKCKKIVSHYHHSCQASQLLHTQQSKLGRAERELIMSVATRWNSDFYMVKRLTEEKAAVSAEITESGKVENLTVNEWKLAEGYAAILAPFEQASRELCGESYPTLSMKIPAIHGLCQQLQSFICEPSNRGSGITLARKLTASLAKRFPSFAEVNIKQRKT